MVSIPHCCRIGNNAYLLYGNRPGGVPRWLSYLNNTQSGLSVPQSRL